MSMKLGKASYEKLIKENIEWIEKYPDTLERKHIKHILTASVNFYYPETELTKAQEEIKQLKAVVDDYEIYNAARTDVIVGLNLQAKRLKEVVEAADKLVNYQGPCIEREVEKRCVLIEALSKLKQHNK